MSSPTEITPQQLSRLIGLPDAPIVLDVRSDDAFGRDPRLIPTAVRRDARAVETWGSAYAGRRLVVVCLHGGALSQGAAAWLRQQGAEAARASHVANQSLLMGGARVRWNAAAGRVEKA